MAVVILHVHGVLSLFGDKREQDRKFACECNNEAPWCYHCCSRKAMSITYCECVCSFSYPAHKGACAILCCYLRPVRIYNILPHTRTLKNGMFFLKEATEHKMCALIFLQPLCKTPLIVRRIQKILS